MDVKKIIILVKRWIIFIVLGGIIGGAAGYYLSNQETPVYQASTRFMFLFSGLEGGYIGMNPGMGMGATLTELINADFVIERASQTLGFPISPGMATVSQDMDSPFVNLTVRHVDPEKAAAIANGLVDVMINEIELLTSSQYLLAQELLEERIDLMEGLMGDVQNQISDISQVNIEESKNQVQLQIEDLQSQINELEIKVTSIDPEFATYEETLERSSYQNSLDQLRPILEQYQRIYTNLIVLGQPLQESSPASFSQLDQLKTSFELYRQIYVSSMASLEELRLSQAQNSINVIRSRRATIPRTPISPKPMQTATLYSAVGVMLIGGIAFLVEYLDNTIKTPEEVKAILGLPVVGLIAEFNGKKKNKEQFGILVHQHPRSFISEAFRTLRTNLEFSSIDTPLKTVMITSIGEGEGKTSVASNLALAYAQDQKRVLLLDTDLRRPATHLQFNKSNRVGLSDLIRGNLNLEDVVQHPTNNQDFALITTGSLPPNPGELLGSQRMSTVLQSINNNFDMVIIDAPPMILADPLILSTKVDGIILVLQPSKVTSEVAITQVEQLYQVNARILGIVINRIPQNRQDYYGGYRHYHGYYNGNYQHYFDSASD